MEENITSNASPDKTPMSSVSQRTFLSYTVVSVVWLMIGFVIGFGYARASVVKNVMEQNIPTPTSSAPSPEASSSSAKNNPLPSATPTPTTITLRGNLCPVAFALQSDRVYMPAKQAYATWQVKEFSAERFGFMPRAEEVNGRRVDVQLRTEDQLYGNGAATISVYCQDNPNKWNQADFLSYVLKTPDIMDPSMTQVSLWGRQVGRFSFKGYDGNVHNEWFMAEKGLLFHASPIIYDESVRTQAESVFKDLSFFP